ncbi:MAG: NADPH:quinone reductase-like Zn-dependent oxidoreductase [Arcticibacterium sp.]|jgi:NADPH:quinone reductase-like Zn-dependent oxidoreductase
MSKILYRKAMKAFVYKNYGEPEKVLELIEIEKPTPKEFELLIRIKSTTINDYDWSMLRARPKLYRLLFGLFKPKHTTPGMELAGIVEAIGSKVQGFKVGNAVFGDISAFGFGTFAAYIAIHEKAVVHKPSNISFEEAASMPHALMLAWQGLKSIGKNQKVLINGGGGGVGTFGIQIAKHYDCEVTGIDSAAKLEMMKTLDYDHIIDYQKTDFTKNGEQYDLILDCKSKKSAFAYTNALKPKGIYVSIGGDLSSIFSVLFWGKVISIFSNKKIGLLALKPNEGLKEVSEELNLKYQVDGPHAFEDIPKLIQYFGEGKHKGKVVVNI